MQAKTNAGSPSAKNLVLIPTVLHQFGGTPDGADAFGL